MKTNTITKKLINRLNNIETLLSRHYNTYNHSARHSTEFLMALTAISNLESERSMLEVALTNTKVHI